MKLHVVLLHVALCQKHAVFATAVASTTARACSWFCMSWKKRAGRASLTLFHTPACPPCLIWGSGAKSAPPPPVVAADPVKRAKNLNKKLKGIEGLQVCMVGPALLSATRVALCLPFVCRMPSCHPGESHTQARPNAACHTKHETVCTGGHAYIRCN